MQPMPRFPSTSKRPRSTQRLSIEYDGWWIKRGAHMLSRTSAASPVLRAAEVVPKAKGDPRQQHPATTRAAVLHALVALFIRLMGHLCSPSVGVAKPFLRQARKLSRRRPALHRPVCVRPRLQRRCRAMISVESIRLRAGTLAAHIDREYGNPAGGEVGRLPRLTDIGPRFNPNVVVAKPGRGWKMEREKKTSCQEVSFMVRSKEIIK